MPAPTSLPTASGLRISSIPPKKNYGSQSRRGLEATSEIPKLTTRKGADGKTRRQPARNAPIRQPAPAIAEDEPPLPFNTGVLHYDVERGCEAIQTLLHDLMPLFATGADMINAVPGLRTNLPFDDIKIDQ